MKETESKSKYIPCLWTKRININIMSMLPKFVYKFNTSSVKIQSVCFTEIEKAILKSI